MTNSPPRPEAEPLSDDEQPNPPPPTLPLPPARPPPTLDPRLVKKAQKKLLKQQWANFVANTTPSSDQPQASDTAASAQPTTSISNLNTPFTYVQAGTSDTSSQNQSSQQPIITPAPPPAAPQPQLLVTPAAPVSQPITPTPILAVPQPQLALTTPVPMYQPDQSDVSPSELVAGLQYIDSQVENTRAGVEEVFTQASSAISHQQAQLNSHQGDLQIAANRLASLNNISIMFSNRFNELSGELAALTGTVGTLQNTSNQHAIRLTTAEAKQLADEFAFNALQGTVTSMAPQPAQAPSAALGGPPVTNPQQSLITRLESNQNLLLSKLTEMSNQLLRSPQTNDEMKKQMLKLQQDNNEMKKSHDELKQTHQQYVYKTQPIINTFQAEIKFIGNIVISLSQYDDSWFGNGIPKFSEKIEVTLKDCDTLAILDSYLSAKIAAEYKSKVVVPSLADPTVRAFRLMRVKLARVDDIARRLDTVDELSYSAWHFGEVTKGSKELVATIEVVLSCDVNWAEEMKANGLWLREGVSITSQHGTNHFLRED